MDSNTNQEQIWNLPNQFSLCSSLKSISESDSNSSFSCTFRVLFLEMDRDRISKLPDHLLTQILSCLSTKESVTTSVLSKRWESLWLKVPRLDLIFSRIPGCRAIFVNNFLESNENLRMEKFKIMYDKYCIYRDRIVEWIGTTVDRGIQHLDVECFEACWFSREVMPQNIYRSNTLVSLRLTSVEIKTPGSVVSLPCLKIMHLEDIWYNDPLIMEKLISGCPVLEDLTLLRYYSCKQEVLLFLRVRSQTLKRFRYWFETSLDGKYVSVELDAPGLEYLSFQDNRSDKIVLKNLSSLIMIDINTEFNYERSILDVVGTISDFLTGVSSVRHMIISKRTLEVHDQYCGFGGIPIFENLYRLEAEFSSLTLHLLPVFLDSCPNLKHLIVDFDVSREAEHIVLSSILRYVPRCLLSTLECVEIRSLIKWELTGMEIVDYLVMNSAVLKKLSLSYIMGYYSSMTNIELDIYKGVLIAVKRSRRCQVFIN